MVDRVWVCVYMGDGMGVCACLNVCVFIWVMVYGCVCGADNEYTARCLTDK